MRPIYSTDFLPITFTTSTILFKQRHTWLQNFMLFPIVSPDIICWVPAINQAASLFDDVARETTDHTVAGECALQVGRHKQQDYRKNAFIRSGILSWSHLSRSQNGRSRYGEQPVQLGSTQQWEIKKQSRRSSYSAYMRHTGKGDRSEHGWKSEYSEIIVSLWDSCWPFVYLLSLVLRPGTTMLAVGRRWMPSHCSKTHGHFEETLYFAFILWGGVSLCSPNGL